MDGKKDFWDKLDVFGKIFSGVVLAAIVVVIKMGADDIATSMHTGELAKNLINDLTKKDEKIRQDIALITLNRAIGDKNPHLIVDIAENIFNANKEYVDLSGNVAFAIIKERNPAKAEEIRKKVVAFTDNPDLRKNLRSASDLTQSTSTRTEVPAQAQLISRVYKNVIYIQFRGEKNKFIIEELRLKLNKEGYAPGVELVDKDYPNSIRYFHQEDRGLAEQVASIARSFLKEKKYEINLTPQDLSGKFKIPKGQVEVWINLERP